MIVCKFCECFDCFKIGFVRGGKRYECKKCGKNFTRCARKRQAEPPCFIIKRSFNEPNCATFGVSASAVLKWAGTLGSRLCAKIELYPEDNGIVMEVDEF
ncbi:hypothetical protein HE1_00294 [Holospora elegans E1]|uniref:Uncharacterized protein n=1 Tax=Holospora elegans E1 TaxID=1427503 RepID=A0A023DX97_9PROT|nr:hypothetical protein HE1_00294 [Holospora elegans E1]